jgi:hypothetical protein
MAEQTPERPLLEALALVARELLDLGADWRVGVLEALMGLTERVCVLLSPAFEELAQPAYVTRHMS